MSGEIFAVFGGTFDPIHTGHLRSTLEAAEELGLSRVLFMPCADPPHSKTVQAVIEHRLAMVRLAVEGEPLFGVSDREAKRGGFSKTVDTLAEISRDHPGSRVLFLLGADSFFTIHTWYEPRRLFDLADFLIMSRPGTPTRDLSGYLRGNVDPAFQYAGDGWSRLPSGGGARRVHTTLLEISSTDIKRRVREGRRITYLVPPKVEEYINDMHLYTQNGDDS